MAAREECNTYQRLLNAETDRRATNIYMYPKITSCLFGIDDCKQYQHFLYAWRSNDRIAKSFPYLPGDMKSAIKCYQSVEVTNSMDVRHKGLYTVSCQIINAFLTESAYKHSLVKYSNIIQNYQYQNFFEFFRYTRQNPQFFNDNNDDAKDDEKYDNDGEDQKMDTLRTKHIMTADAFMIVYDIRYQKELDKVKRYLDEIFKMKGYNKLLDKVREDEMCFFPISLIGINWDETTDQNNKISRAQINEIAFKYCVNVDRVELYRDYNDWSGYYVEKHAEARGFTNHVLDYYYYRSLSDQTVKRLKETANNDCIIF